MKRALFLGLGVGGALLLAIPAHFYRPDRVWCDAWPGPSTGGLMALVHLAAVGLLAACWWGFVKVAPPRRLAGALGLGAIVHAAAVVAPPYLSHDPLFYAAIGRAMARYHASPYVPLDRTLPATDPFVAHLMNEGWRHGTSAYFPGWNELSRVVAMVGGDAQIVHLRIYQVIGLLAMMLTAALAGRAARDASDGDEAAGARAAALVAFSPLAVIEGTQAAHNDGWLAVAAAAFAWATVRRRPLAGLLALAGGLAVKVSAALLLGVNAVQLATARVRWTAARAGAVAAAVVVAGALAGPWLLHSLGGFSVLIGRPSDPFYCVRAPECLPRTVLYHVFDAKVAAWAIGLVARGLGALWLLYAGVRWRKQPLAGCAIALFVYYLYLHGWLQSWYLLPLLPLMPFAEPRHRPAMAVACVTAVLYYGIKLITDCDAVPLGFRIAGGACEAVVVLLAPTVLLVRAAIQRRRERASAAA